MTYVDEYTPLITGEDITHALCDYAVSNLEGTGVVRQYYPNRIADITDGTSNTFVAGDKRLNIQQLGTWQPDDNEGYTCGWDEDTVRSTDTPPLPDYQAASGTGQRRFGSSHPGSFHMVFADGSVRVLTYSVDPDVFSYLGNKSDGQVTPDDSY